MTCFPIMIRANPNKHLPISIKQADDRSFPATKQPSDLS